MPPSDSVLNRIRIHNLNWSKILGVDTFRFERNPDWVNYSLRSADYRSATLGMMRFLLRDLFRYRDELESLDPANKPHFLFFKSLNRPDYDEFFNAVSSRVQSEGVVQVVANNRTQRLNWSAYWLFLRHVFALVHLTRRLGSFKALYFYTKIVRYLCVLRRLKTIHPKAVVVFADMHPLDNLVSQYYGQKGTPTATLQHGLYVDYGDEHTVNRLNYSNVVSNYFLSWGTNTSNIIMRHNAGVKTIICGKPTLRDELKIDKNAGYFTVLFDQKIYTDQNQRLLDIAAAIAVKFNLKVALKLHPTTKRAHYRFDVELEAPTDTDWEKSRFCIGHSTSMIYEMLRRGMPVFKLKTDVPGHALPEAFSFSTAEELMSKLNQDVDPVENGQEFVKYIGAESLNQYAKALKSL